MKEKQQIIFIHGGESFNSYEQYISFIKKVPLYDLDNSTKSLSWYKHLYDFLPDSEYEIFSLKMPSKENAKYNEWKIWFERHIPYLKEDLILIGHSLGGIFCAKYLSENNLNIKINQLHLVAPPYNDENEIEQLDDFKITEFPKDFFKINIDEIHIYHSTDDTVVPISESETYHAALPGSQLHIFNDRFHFLDETFPELFENIKCTTETL